MWVIFPSDKAALERVLGGCDVCHLLDGSNSATFSDRWPRHGKCRSYCAICKAGFKEGKCGLIRKTVLNLPLEQSKGSLYPFVKRLGQIGERRIMATY